MALRAHPTALLSGKLRPLNSGRQVRRSRLERGLTLAAVADRSGLNVGYLSQIENDKATPSLEVPEIQMRHERGGERRDDEGISDRVSHVGLHALQTRCDALGLHEPDAVGAIPRRNAWRAACR